MASDRTSPTDPRDDLAPVGMLEKITVLEEGVVRVLAPNSSPMTLDGTNTYVVYGRNGSCVMVDPGPRDASHLGAVLGVIEAHKLTPHGIVLTHHHLDHADAAGDWSKLFDVPIYAQSHGAGSTMAAVLNDGDEINLDGDSVVAKFTPGHSADHLCFSLPSGRLLTGDHVLGRGTSVVAYPDGDLEKYLRSLLKISRLPLAGIYPGHGPELDESCASRVVNYYIEHRISRIRQIFAAFGDAPVSLADVVRFIYGQRIAGDLLFAADLSTRAAVAMLVRLGYLKKSSGHDQFLKCFSGFPDFAQLALDHPDA